MLVCYARELKEAFSEYTEEVVKLMVPLLKFYFNDGKNLVALCYPYVSFNSIQLELHSIPVV